MTNENQIVEAENNGLVVPNVKEAVEVMKQFQAIKTSVLDKNDTLSIQGKQFIKRSGWRKVSLAFNIKTQILERKITNEEGIITAEVLVRAIAPNGRYADELAICDSTEFTSRLQATRHNILTKATTRAINRSVSDLCGGGEVSAEEIEIVEGDMSEPANPPASAKQISFLKNLVSKQVNPQNIDYEKLTSREANELIKQLKG